MSVAPFSLPTCFLFAGYSQSGKTYLLKNMLLNMDAVFNPAPHRVIYVYTIFQDAYRELEKNLGDRIQFRTDIPTKEELVQYYEETGMSTMLCLDDKLGSLDNGKSGRNLVELTCVVAHHCKVSIVYLLQNLYHNTDSSREVALNSSVIILFKNERSASQVRKLAGQIFPGNIKYFLHSYELATARPHGYLVVDLTNNLDKKFKLRSHILPAEDLRIYLPSNAAY